MLASLARVLGIVKGFVRENREALGTDIELLTSLLERVDNQKDNLGLVVQKGSSAMSNLAIAFESGTGTYGSRVQLAPGDGRSILRQVLVQQRQRSGGCLPGARPRSSSLLTPRTIGQRGQRERPGRPEAAPETVPEVVPNDLADGLPSLFDLLGGGDE